MDDLLKLPILSPSCHVKDLRFVLDRLTIHVRGLQSLGVAAQQYGSLLTPIVMSKLPPDIRLTVARKSSTSTTWKLTEIIEILKAEVEAREASISLRPNDSSYHNRKQKERNSVGGGPEIATGAFLNNSNSQPGSVSCAFCSKQHYLASCTEITELSKRREILMRDA